MASHERQGLTDEWYTPPWLFDALGVVFDTDAASPGRLVVPWVPAINHITRDSLRATWEGSVWLNPPYGKRNSIRPWLEKMYRHSNGIALVPNRTGAGWWQDSAEEADALLFVRGKIRFLRPDGSEGASPGYGNVLMAYGQACEDALMNCDLRGWRAR